MQDPYAVLGVSRTATDEEITSAYRKLARKYHPDLNPGDKTAEAKMKEINAAYEMIKDIRSGKRPDTSYYGSSDQSNGPYGNPYGNQNGNPYGGYGPFGGFNPFGNYGSYGDGNQDGGSDAGENDTNDNRYGPFVWRTGSSGGQNRTSCLSCFIIACVILFILSILFRFPFLFFFL